MRMMQGTVNREQETGLHLVKRPVGRASAEAVSTGIGLRDGSTGRVVYVAPEKATPETARLQRVWAVADVDTVPPTRDEEAVTDGVPEESAGAVGEVAFYRKYTEALLRRYLRLSMQAGRVPSLMSREVFRGNVSHYRVRGFEDVVIFCHDVEQRLAKLDPREQQLIKRIALQRYTRGEAAGMLGLSLRTCIIQYNRSVDNLTTAFLEAGLLDLSKR